MFLLCLVRVSVGVLSLAPPFFPVTKMTERTGGSIFLIIFERSSITDDLLTELEYLDKKNSETPCTLDLAKTGILSKCNC